MREVQKKISEGKWDNAQKLEQVSALVSEQKQEGKGQKQRGRGTYHNQIVFYSISRSVISSSSKSRPRGGKGAQ